MDLQQEWIRIEVVDGQERFISCTDVWLNEAQPITFEEAVQQVMREAWEQEKLIQKLNVIPEKLRNEFVSKIKNIRREMDKVMGDAARKMAELMEVTGVDLNSKERNEKDRSAFREENPQLGEVLAGFGRRNQELQLKEYELKNVFCSDEWKGQPEQFDTLVRAIIGRIYSKDRRHYPPLPPGYTFPRNPNQTPCPGS